MREYLGPLRIPYDYSNGAHNYSGTYVYFLYNDLDELVYIGSTGDLRTRLKKHDKKGLDYCRVYAREVHPLIRWKVEHQLILHAKPRDNGINDMTRRLAGV